MTGELPSLSVQPAGDPLGALLKVDLFTIHRNAGEGGRFRFSLREGLMAEDLLNLVERSPPAP